MKKIFTKVWEYFTASACRKVFFLGVLATVVSLILYVTTGVAALGMLTMLFGAVTAGTTMVDSMQARITFVRQVKAMQYEHLQKIYEQQQAGQAVAVTGTFTPDETKYIRRKKWSYLVLILLKAAFCLLFLAGTFQFV